MGGRNQSERLVAISRYAHMVRAEDLPAAPSIQNTAPKADHDGMMGGDMQGMKMMGQMSKMTEKCDQMMQTKIDEHKEKTGSPKTGLRG
jgi:hypothetical protein